MGNPREREAPPRTFLPGSSTGTTRGGPDKKLLGGSPQREREGENTTHNPAVKVSG